MSHSTTNHIARAIAGRLLHPSLTNSSQQSLQRIIPASSNALRKFSAVGSNSSSQKPSSLNTPLHQRKISQSSSISFSSAAQTEQEPKPRKKSRSVKRKDPLIITPAAAERIKELLASPNGEGAIGIRLGVKRRGCNGLSYTLNYAFEREPNEEEMEAHGVRVMIEPMALFSVVGTEMDWVVSDMSSEFTFENPNSKGECGCGESFNV